MLRWAGPALSALPVVYEVQARSATTFFTNSKLHPESAEAHNKDEGTSAFRKYGGLTVGV